MPAPHAAEDLQLIVAAVAPDAAAGARYPAALAVHVDSEA